MLKLLFCWPFGFVLPPLQKACKEFSVRPQGENELHLLQMLTLKKRAIYAWELCGQWSPLADYPVIDEATLLQSRLHSLLIGKHLKDTGRQRMRSCHRITFQRLTFLTQIISKSPQRTEQSALPGGGIQNVETKNAKHLLKKQECWLAGKVMKQN